jgi:hypothetical protein
VTSTAPRRTEQKLLSKLLSYAAAVTIAAGMTAAGPAVAAGAAPSATLQACGVASGFLNDGSGAGSAMSLTPGVTPYDGEQFTQQNDSNAWEMCFHSDHTLGPISAPGWCAANNNSLVKLRPCNDTHGDQLWYVDPQSNGSFYFQNNFNGGFLCAADGVGSKDTVAALSGCSSYHLTWKFIAG